MNSGISLEIKSEQYNIKVPLERRVTYLRGDSGVGKTGLVSYINYYLNAVDGIDVLYPKDYDIVVIDTIKGCYSLGEIKNSIVITDDNLGSESSNFSNAVINYAIKNNLYLLIINRVDILEVPESRKGFDYGVRSILWVEKDGTNHIVRSYVDTFLEKSYASVKNILAEDKYGMTEFCTSWNKSGVYIDTTKNKSKDNIIDILISLINSKEGDILLYVDLASFGKYFDELVDTCNSVNTQVIFNKNYESFEYMILCSDYFYGKISYEGANSYRTWERFYEKLLEKLFGKEFGYSYRHGKPLPLCLKGNCENCDLSRCTLKEEKFVRLKKLLRGNMALSEILGY